MTFFKEFIGELIGTFVLVFIGCGSVAFAVLYGNLNLLQVASIWGLGVMLAIIISRKWCPAHLNPAVTLAMTLFGNSPIKKLPLYFSAQFIGALLAGCLLYLTMGNEITHFEAVNSIVRGTVDSQKTAMIFGEFYPNPGNTNLNELSSFNALLLEAAGTFALVFIIFRITSNKLPSYLIPFLIGLTVTAIICVIAPYTQAGLNPARDFGPRVIAFYNGWGEAAFPIKDFGFLIVYILGPFLGASVAVLIEKGLFKKNVNKN